MSVREDSYTQAQFRQAFVRRHQLHRGKRVGNITILGSDSSGTHFFWEDELGDRHFGVISDLTGFHIVRADSTSVTIASLQSSNTTNVALSPALPNTTDFVPLASIEDTSTSFTRIVTVHPRITTISNLRIFTRRVVGNTTSQVATYPSDTQIDVGLGHSHATDVGGADAHTHLIQDIVGALTFNVIWAILKA